MRLLLAPGEQVILKEHPSGHSLVWPLIRAALVAIVAGLLAAQLKPLIVSAGEAAGPVAALILEAIVLILGLWLVYATGLRRVVRWFSTTYLLTTERLILRRGVGGRQEDSIPLPAIYRVDIRQRWYQRSTSTGTLRFTVAQGSEFGILDVPNISVFRAEVVDAISKAQQKHWHVPVEDGR
jgi:uncharacterized membrane protein YdbT with pleckstrin-like domain